MNAEDEWEIYLRHILFRWEGDGVHDIVGMFPEMSELVALETSLVIVIYCLMRNCIIRKDNLVLFRARCLIITNLNMRDCLRNIG